MTCKLLKLGKIPAMQYKGFTVIFVNGEYRASAYANPQFTGTNYAQLKKEINQYLSNG